ncbi:MAG TPA: carboxypeptidase-like regulatory domain-containing protein [Allosphingosinicella sp.]|nr:carboxypeptidase-like regulatory domain-containing protein [Allosphingosinicella sp.]
MRDLRVSFPRPCDEKWEAMTPAGCDRVCARCDKLIHDLSQYQIDEAEALLRRNPGTCKRAHIDTDGVVALKPGRRGRARRMVIAVAATAGLLTAGAPAFAKRDRPDGAISGNVESFGIRMRVTATGTGGQTFRARAKSNGRFRIRRLPAGTYTLTFVPECGNSWMVENVVVRDGETIVPNVGNADGCIIIGLLRIEDGRG